MNYKIYVEALNGFPRNDWSCSAYLGFKERQADIYFYEDIKEVPTQRNIVLVGCIEDTNEFLGRFGLGPKKAINIPEELNHPRYTSRGIGEFTFDSWRERSESPEAKILGGGWPVFIKPANKSKEFVAGVVKNRELFESYFYKLPGDTPILCSQVVNFISEYRCYIIEGKVVGIKHYLGDIFTFPDPKRIQEMVVQYKSAPAGYSLDVGILNSGETVLVECNDGWSLGNYGLDPNLYVRLLVARWREIFKPSETTIVYAGGCGLIEPFDKNDVPGLKGMG